jgi:S1/P1 Nuclease
MHSKHLLCSLAVMFFSIASVQAHAWGCEGHEIVALIAMKQLQPQVANQVNAILSASPVSPSLKRYCRTSGLPLIADVASWADDVRSEQPETGPYHFVDIPLTATRDKYDVNQVCQQTCVIDVIGKFTQQLKTSTDPKARADALRFLIHFVGDIHQPLHDETNGDRGGNCVPVEYEDESPRKTNAEHEDYFPNLHAVWDTDILQSMLAQHDMTLEQYSDFLTERYHPRLQRWTSGQPIDWAWEGHDDAVVAYRALPANVPRDANVQVSSCADNNHIGNRMSDLHIVLGPRYENVSRPIVEEQLTKAGIRLAALLNSTLGK